MTNNMKISFIGATDDVTGSMTLLECSQGKILIDSGLYQGPDEVVKKNFNPLSFNPKDIKAIVLTHAHLDHSGFIPRLVKLGFRGDIFGSKPTLKLAQIIMNDSAQLLMNKNTNAQSAFYEKSDVMVATSLFKPKKINEDFSIFDLTFSFQPAGHILGACSIIIKGDQTIVFSGDIGRSNDPLMPSPPKCPKTNTLILESTYGGKIRTGNLEEELISFLRKIKNESKVGIIASFAVARSQLLITLINQYFEKHPDEKIRVVMDGPMGVLANKIYKEYSSETRLPHELSAAISEIEIIGHVREWKSLSKKTGPLVVITSSGMVTGGRIWRYLENWQNDKNACLFLPGFQGVGTAGRALSEGERTIHSEEGKEINWTGEVISSGAFSSHADQNELLSWISDLDKETEIYLNHGEESSKQLFQEKLRGLGFTKVSIAKP